MTRETRTDLHQTITNTIVAMLEDAQASGASFPWCRQGVTLSRPTNALTQKRYRGINVLTLWCEAESRNFRSGIFATYKQWQELGAQVRQGERSSPIVFYRSYDAKRRRSSPRPPRQAKPRNSGTGCNHTAA